MELLHQVVKVYRDTQSLRQTGEYFGKSSYWVRMRLAEAREPVNPPTPPVEFDVDTAQKLRKEGKPYEAIAQELQPDGGLSGACVRQRLIRRRQVS
jgi:hypothetical protein